MTRQKSTKMGSRKGRAATVNHAAVAWALSLTLALEPEGATARRIMEAASRLGGAIAEYDTFDLRAETMLCGLLNAHAGCAYDLLGQDRAKGRSAYAALVRLAGGPDGAPEPKRRTSAEWCHWKMRNVAANLEGRGSKGDHSAAWGCFHELLNRLTSDPDFWRLSSVRTLIVGLIYAQRELGQIKSAGHARNRNGGAR